MTTADLADIATLDISAARGPERWIEWNRRNYAEHGYGLWVIETHAGEFVGDCGLTRGDSRSRRDRQRADRAFFAAGACHILAWTCRELYPVESIGITALRAADEEGVFHIFATWNEWAFDHCGWHTADDLVSVNQDFVGNPLIRVEITTDLAEFCRQHYHRVPHQYYDDPRPRARVYVRRFGPPWSQ